MVVTFLSWSKERHQKRHHTNPYLAVTLVTMVTFFIWVWDLLSSDHPVYTLAELEQLFRGDISPQTISMLHQAKKSTGASVGVNVF